jgi:hypothetical protein
MLAHLHVLTKTIVVGAKPNGIIIKRIDEIIY